jgi:hypothetical protein
MELVLLMVVELLLLLEQQIQELEVVVVFRLKVEEVFMLKVDIFTYMVVMIKHRAIMAKYIYKQEVIITLLNKLYYHVHQQIILENQH